MQMQTKMPGDNQQQCSMLLDPYISCASYGDPFDTGMGVAPYFEPTLAADSFACDFARSVQPPFDASSETYDADRHSTRDSYSQQLIDDHMLAHDAQSVINGIYKRDRPQYLQQRMDSQMQFQQQQPANFGSKLKLNAIDVYRKAKVSPGLNDIDLRGFKNEIEAGSEQSETMDSATVLCRKRKARMETGDSHSKRLKSKTIPQSPDPTQDAPDAEDDSKDAGQAFAFHSIADAKDHSHVRVPKSNIHGDDWQEIQDDEHLQKHYVRTLKAAFAKQYQGSPDDNDTKHHDRAHLDEWERWQAHHYADLMHLLTAEGLEHQAEKAAWLLLDAILEVHRLGARKSSYGADKNLICSIRITRIAEYISQIPLFAIDVLKLEDLHEMAASPAKYRQRKITNLWGNWRKKEKRPEPAGKPARRHSDSISAVAKRLGAVTKSTTSKRGTFSKRHAKNVCNAGRDLRQVPATGPELEHTEVEGIQEDMHRDDDMEAYEEWDGLEFVKV